jgi:hypothetical protein
MPIGPNSHIQNRNQALLFAGSFDFFQQFAGIFRGKLPMGIIIQKGGKARPQGIWQKNQWLTVIKGTLSWAEN